MRYTYRGITVESSTELDSAVFRPLQEKAKEPDKPTKPAKAKRSAAKSGKE